MAKYHVIFLGIILFISAFGFAIPFATVAYCYSVQVFDDSCLRMEYVVPHLTRLAGAEIYYEHLIYHMNPYLAENHDNEKIYQPVGSVPENFPSEITIKYNEEHRTFEPVPRTLLISLKHNSSVTITNESKLDYSVFSRGGIREIQLADTISAEDTWARNFTDAGVYSYVLEPVSDHDRRTMTVRISVIDEPLEKLPQSLKNIIACTLGDRQDKS